jgi:DHA2 family methylenomycin A resistance protein-like MFS transporter
LAAQTRPMPSTQTHAGPGPSGCRPGPQPGPAPRTSPLALIVICIGYFLVILDAMVVNVALPAIGRDLHGGVSSLQWVVDAYTISFAGLLLAGGALAERLGGRRVFVGGLVLFTLASAACGLAPAMSALVAARPADRPAGLTIRYDSAQLAVSPS